MQQFEFKGYIAGMLVHQGPVAPEAFTLNDG